MMRAATSLPSLIRVPAAERSFSEFPPAQLYLDTDLIVAYMVESERPLSLRNTTQHARCRSPGQCHFARSVRSGVIRSHIPSSGRTEPLERPHLCRCIVVSFG